MALVDLLGGCVKKIKVIGEDVICHPEDCQRIQKIMADRGYYATIRQCDLMWRAYSDRYAAGWLGLPEDDDGVFAEIATEFEVVGETTYPETSPDYFKGTPPPEQFSAPIKLLSSALVTGNYTETKNTDLFEVRPQLEEDIEDGETCEYCGENPCEYYTRT